MNTEENKRMYANRFTITVGPTDTALTFNWVVPAYDENGKIAGDKTVDSFLVSMSRENFAQLHGLINELHEKVMNDDNK